MPSTILPKAIAQVITPPDEPEQVAEFLWKHMQRDLDVLGRALGRSVDDAALTVHLVLQQMILLNGGQTGKRGPQFSDIVNGLNPGVSIVCLM